MTKLLFIRQPHVYLPEIYAYKAYFVKHFPNIKVFESIDLNHYNEGDYDVLWHFMGLDFKGSGDCLVHEYNSLSTPPFSLLKNGIKKALNALPDRRVFLNQTVSKLLGFKDEVPAFFRDMGVDDAFYNVQKVEPMYDFICVGGLARGSIIGETISHIVDNMKDAKVLLVGSAPQTLKKKFKGNDRVTFTGRVDYSDVPDLMASARYGLNIMPDVLPFNVQTSTKVFEYSAVGLPIVSTDYQWIRSFESQYGAECFKISDDYSNLTKENLEKFDFRIPEMQDLKWDNVISNSGIFDFLK